MIGIQEEKSTYLSEFERFEKSAGFGAIPWLNALRREAIRRFTALGFPTTRDEEWRHTNIAPIAAASFAPARPGSNGLSAGKLGDYIFGEAECCNLVFVNGFYSPNLSEPGTLPRGVRTASLAEVLSAEPGVLEPHLARHVNAAGQTFVALNTAFLQDGAFIHIPPGTKLDKVIHLLYISTPEAQALATFPRNLIVAGRGSQASVVESYIGIQGGAYFTNAVTEIFAEDGAVLSHYTLQRESPDAFHVGNMHILQEKNTDVSCHSISLGGILARNDVTGVMNGEGGGLTLNGLYVARDRQHMDNHTSIIHARPHCSSRELYKGILDGEARGVFNGKVVVKPNAQKTNARQTNKNLLLSKEALVNTAPQLEIFADDVKCTHGATIGRLNEEELFYLRTRGIEEQAARDLLTYAFASDVLGAVRIKPLQCQLALVLLARLSRSRQMEVPL
jgi:Fe-S cluster assembly protein SufD